MPFFPVGSGKMATVSGENRSPLNNTGLGLEISDYTPHEFMQIFDCFPERSFDTTAIHLACAHAPVYGAAPCRGNLQGLRIPVLA